jgi:chitinase
MTCSPRRHLGLCTSLPILLLLLSTALWAAPPSPRPQVTATPAAHPLLIGYFPQWGLYNEPQYTVKNMVTSGGAAVLDQLNYAQGFVTDRHCSVADPNADLNYTFTADTSVDGTADLPTQPFRGNFHQLAELKRKYPRLKIIISLEGKADSFAEDAQPENREAFVTSCVDLFLKGHLSADITAPGIFDGIDIDWEYPHEPDAANYLSLLTEFRRQMSALRPGLLLTIAVGHNPRMYPGTDMALVSSLVDQVGLMTYDFNGPWNSTTGFIAPLSTDPAATHQGGTVERTIAAYKAAGVPASKLLMGVPFYGYGWKQVNAANSGLFQEGKSIRGDRPYSYIETLIAQTTVYRDPNSQAPWLYDGDSFWTYEDPVSVQFKASFAIQQQLGGLMIWELGEDTPSALLLHAAHTGLAQPAAPAPSNSASQLTPASSTKIE